MTILGAALLGIIINTVFQVGEVENKEIKKPIEKSRIIDKKNVAKN